MSTSITTHVSNYGEKHGDPSQTMKALTWQGNRTVKVVETVIPKIIDPGDAIVKVTGSTICGSDLHLYHGAIPELQKGDILGHEFCGIVVTVGQGVQKVKVGDRVVASFQIACGQCYYCKQGLPTMCERTNTGESATRLYGQRMSGFFGYSHFTGGFAGGQSEFVRVPHGDVNLLNLPDDVPDEKGLYLSDVLGTSWNAVVDTGVKEGNTVAIWGAGPVGQMAAEYSFFHGAKRVILIDSGQGKWRLDFIKKILPKLETIDFANLPKGESVPSTLKKMCDGHGPDVAIECAADKSADDTIQCNHFNIGALMECGIKLHGNGQAPVQKYWKGLLRYIQEDKIHPLNMVTHRFKLEDMEKVYDLFDKREPGMQKVFIQTRFSAPPSPGSRPLTVL
ncbi:glutathione dependent formaldehyde dehydrogenase [Aspergillus fumigatus]|nr:glutathione dependent formaldehyde dehydrogenase [Aspergillus fumigatus]